VLKVKQALLVQLVLKVFKVLQALLVQLVLKVK
jgi:hypothetical protein